jgi:exopolysaccharide production protein ExoZ
VNKRSIDWIQALRGIAAMMVVVTHARHFPEGTPWEGFAQRLMFPGAMGVDLFFLVSGFIMAYTTAGSDGSARYVGRFFIKRFSRIWPVYVVLSLIAVMVLDGVGFFVSDWPVVAKSFLFLPVNATQLPYLGLAYPLGWTLNFEAYFYLVFGLSMLCGKWRWNVFFGWLVASLVILPAVATGVVSLDPAQSHGFPAWIEQITNPIIWEFAAGVVIGLAYRSPVQWGTPISLVLACAVAIAFAIYWTISGAAVFHGIGQWGGPLALVMFAMAFASKQMHIPAPRALVWLGKVSFSLYLTHMLTFTACIALLTKLGFEPFTHTWYFVFAAMVCALLVADVSWRVLENGLSEWVKRILLRQSSKPIYAEPVAAISGD